MIKIDTCVYVYRYGALQTSILFNMWENNGIYVNTYSAGSVVGSEMVYDSAR